jgi:tetratricopeptide (TPR) repeat protein
MAKTRPDKKNSKKRKKTILNTVAPNRSSSKLSLESPSVLIERATALLQTSQPQEALTQARKALILLQSPSERPTAQLPALELLGQIQIELGELELAREKFEQAAKLDPDGSVPESEGGGAEKFFWLAQLSEEGGKESIGWFKRGTGVLRRQIGALEGKIGAKEDLEEKKRRLANALCGMCEVYMTDLA